MWYGAEEFSGKESFHVGVDTVFLVDTIVANAVGGEDVDEPFEVGNGFFLSYRVSVAGSHDGFICQHGGTVRSCMP